MAALLTLCGVAANVRVANAGSQALTGVRAGPSHLYIMFLPGLCGYPGSDPYCKGNVNAKARAQGTFKTLTTSLGKAHVAYSPLYYSYNGTSATYTVNQTHQSVAQSVDALEAQLRAVRKRDTHAVFDLVGHSLGGVVAASWAVSNGREYGYNPGSGLLRDVNSIVTFDSPLRGIDTRYTNNLVARLIVGTVAYSLQPDSETIKEIVFFPDSWWRSTGHLHTIANSADILVPPPEALMGDRKLVLDSHCSRDLLFVSTCHGAVLVDSTLNTYVACHWITTPYQCSPAPTRTPTRVPTATRTPTTTPVPTSTPTATAGPPPTATFTISATVTPTATP